MSERPDWIHGRLPRLPGHNYTSTAGYFLTINTWRRFPLFGGVHNGRVVLSRFGRIVEEEWLRTALLRPEIRLDSFILMPNHFHGIVHFTEEPVEHVGSRKCSSAAKLTRPARSLGSLVAGFKASSARRINIARAQPGAVVWQKNYYEHVIRNERELARIRQYIVNNPMKLS